MSQAWDTGFGKKKLRKTKPKPQFVMILSCSNPQNGYVPRFSEHSHDVGKYSMCLHNSGSRRSSPTWFVQSLVLWLVSMHTNLAPRSKGIQINASMRATLMNINEQIKTQRMSVSMYVCGSTVYTFIVIFFMILIRAADCIIVNMTSQGVFSC